MFEVNFMLATLYVGDKYIIAFKSCEVNGCIELQSTRMSRLVISD